MRLLPSLLQTIHHPLSRLQIPLPQLLFKTYKMMKLSCVMYQIPFVIRGRKSKNEADENFEASDSICLRTLVHPWVNVSVIHM